MKTSLVEPLATQWASDARLKSKVQSWSWFSHAFAEVLQKQMPPPSGWNIDEDSLAAVFFSWAEAVELYSPYEAVDAADFRQFVMGQLLQKLLEARPPVLHNVPAASAAGFFTSFVLTLLQALHVQAGSSELRLDEAALTGPRWASFLENVSEDASNATCFLDQMTGLQPVWQSRSLIEHRPAMQKALAQRRQASAELHVGRADQVLPAREIGRDVS